MTNSSINVSTADIAVQMTLKAWNIQQSRADKFFNGLSEADLQKEIAPGKNRIIYLLGHLIASNDTMIGLFALGPRLYAHFDEPFLKNPDKSGQEMPDGATLLSNWKHANTTLNEYFSKMTAESWLSKHTAMTDEDYEKEPSRNKLSVLINRTNHMAYHLGQLVLTPLEK